MNISYEAYRVFYYTAKTKSFTQAANALGNSQPNITRIIKNLERELGCALCHYIHLYLSYYLNKELS